MKIDFTIAQLHALRIVCGEVLDYNDVRKSVLITPQSIRAAVNASMKISEALRKHYRLKRK